MNKKAIKQIDVTWFHKLKPNKIQHYSRKYKKDKQHWANLQVSALEKKTWGGGGIFVKKYKIHYYK